MISRPTFERSVELVDVVVIVRGKTGDPVCLGQAPLAEMDASAPPLCRRQGLQERQHLGPAPPKCGESLPGVIAEILTFQLHPIGV